MPATRLPAARTAPCSSASAARTRAASSSGSPAEPSTIAHSSSSRVATSARAPSSPSARSSASSAAAGSATSNTSTAACSPTPNGRRRPRSSPSSSAPSTHLVEHVAGEPPLGVAHDPAAHQLERHHRDRLLEDQALELAEAATVADRDDPRRAARRGSAATGSASARPATSSWAGSKATARPCSLRSRTSARIASSAVGRKLAPEGRGCHRARLRVEHHDRAADRGRRARAPPRPARAARARAARAAGGPRCRAGAPRTAR